jgi:hypothetical protein
VGCSAPNDSARFGLYPDPSHEATGTCCTCVLRVVIKVTMEVSLSNMCPQLFGSAIKQLIYIYLDQYIKLFVSSSPSYIYFSREERG